MTNKNSRSRGATRYSAVNHTQRFMNRIFENSANAFHPTTWEMRCWHLPICGGAAQLDEYCGKKGWWYGVRCG